MIEDGNQTKIGSSLSVSPSPEFSDRFLDGYSFYVNGTCIGEITDIIDQNTLTVTPYEKIEGDNIKYGTPIMLSVVEADLINSVFAYNSNYSSINSNRPVVSNYLGEILKKIED